MCDDPPDDFCDGDDAVTYLPAGSCSMGMCDYGETRTDCSSLGLPCINGACDDPCDGTICVTPPSPTCDGDEVVVFETNGMCVAGMCEYPERTAQRLRGVRAELLQRTVRQPVHRGHVRHATGARLHGRCRAHLHGRRKLLAGHVQLPVHDAGLHRQRTGLLRWCLCRRPL